MSRDVPRVTFLLISETAITYWSAAIEEALGRRPRKTLVPPTGIAVRITSHNVRAFGLGAAATYTLGDVASFSAAEADRLCRSGAAVPVDERDRSRFQLDPREVAPPEPVDGRIQVMFGSPGRGPDGSAYSHGDIALFDAPVATRFVRSGVAEFLHPVRLDAEPTDLFEGIVQ